MSVPQFTYGRKRQHMKVRMSSRAAIGALIAATLVAGTTGGAIANAQTSAVPTTTTKHTAPAVRAELDQLNAKMRAFYGESRNSHLARQPLVLVGYLDHIEVR